MISRYQAALNGVALSSLHESLYIHDIEYEAPNIQTKITRIANQDGAFPTDRYQEKSTVRISFELPIYDIADRQEACQAVVKWARNGGILTTNDRPGQRLRVICAQVPVITSALKWTELLSVVFESYAPYWEEVTPATLTLTGAEASGTLNIPGNIGMAKVDAVITPSASISSVTVYADNSYLTISGITGSGVITIDHDAHGFLRIEQNDVSLLDKRTGSDDLIAESGGYNGFAVDASASVTVVFSVRGLWA